MPNATTNNSLSKTCNQKWLIRQPPAFKNVGVFPPNPLRIDAPDCRGIQFDLTTPGSLLSRNKTNKTVSEIRRVSKDAMSAYTNDICWFYGANYAQPWRLDESVKRNDMYTERPWRCVSYETGVNRCVGLSVRKFPAENFRKFIPIFPEIC